MPSYTGIGPPTNPVLLKLAEAAQLAGVTVEYVRVRGKRIISIRKIVLNGNLCCIQHLSNLFSRGDRNAIYARSTLLRDRLEAYPFHIFAVELKYSFWFFIVPRDALKAAFINTELKFIDAYIRVNADSKSTRATNFDFGRYFEAWEMLACTSTQPAELVTQSSALHLSA
jgi:hypothetical protein